MSGDIDKDFILTLVILILIIIRLVGNSKGKANQDESEILRDVVADEIKKALGDGKDDQKKS